MSAINGVLDAIAAAPDLRRGRCVGQWEVWDSWDDVGLVEYAIAGCQSCAELQKCRDYVESLPARHRPHGVIAGVCRRPPKSRKAQEAS